MNRRLSQTMAALLFVVGVVGPIPSASAQSVKPRNADSEAEMAWFIAQMVAHVAARHETENQAKATLMQESLIPQIIMTGGVAATAIQEAAQLGLPMTMFHFSKQAVSEADFLGLEYL